MKGNSLRSIQAGVFATSVVIGIGVVTLGVIGLSDEHVSLPAGDETRTGETWVLNDEMQNQNIAASASLPNYDMGDAMTKTMGAQTTTDIDQHISHRLASYTAGLLILLETGRASASDAASVERALEISRRNNENTRSDISEQIQDIESSFTDLSVDGIFTNATLGGDISLTDLAQNRLLFTDSSGLLTASSALSFVDGMLGLGTTSPQERLSIDGALYLGSFTPASTAHRLYNDDGDLYWNGSILSSSSSAAWTLGSGNAFRLSGNVGIGTSNPTSTLTVNGTALFAGALGITEIEHNLTVAGTTTLGTTTGAFLDTGGAVCNVNAYGAVGDNSTDNHAAIMAAIDDCEEGGVVYFPPGQYRISEPLVLDTPVTLRGSYAPRWSYSSTPRSSIRASFGTFVGGAIIHVRDRTISGQASDNNGGRLENIGIDGGSWGADIHGIHFEGLVRDWRLVDVDISQTTGNGFLAEVGAGSGNPRGFTIRGLSIYSADGHGFRATALNDTYMEDVLTVGNALRGFYLSSLGETKLNNSRAAFNALEGLYIDGASNNGGLQVTDFSTDRNDRHGVRISATGTTTISFNGLLTRRDGKNDGGGTETPYAGVSIIGSSTGKVAPVVISNLTQITGINDGGGGTPSPSVGLRVDQATYVTVDGVLWGVDQAYVDGGTNDTFVIAEETLMKVGHDAAVAESLYNQKWIRGVGSVSFDERVGIGTTTPTSKFYVVNDDDASAVATLAGASGQSADYFRIKSTLEQDVGDILTVNATGYLGLGTTTMPRRLTIAGSDNVGARFTNSVNNARFDLRVETSQAFIGTMSNHDLRFITNGSSKVAITAGGNMGVGTTTPWRTLSVQGTASFSGLTAAIASGDAVCLSSTNELVENTGAQTCTVSSARFKNSIFELTPEESAHIASLLSPKSFEYNDTDEERIGLIAEDVEAIDERLIFREADGTPRGVRYEDIVAVLIGAFKHQQAQIASLMSSGVAAVGDAVVATFDQLFAKKIVVEELEVDSVQVAEDAEIDGRLCVQGTCVTGADLLLLLENAGIAPGEPVTPPAETAPDPAPSPTTEPELADAPEVADQDPEVEVADTAPDETADSEPADAVEVDASDEAPVEEITEQTPEDEETVNLIDE